MADQTTEQTTAEAAVAEKRKKMIKYAVIAVVVGVALWFIYKKVLK